MSRPIIEVRNVSKLYRLGAIGAGTFQDALKRRWALMLGREDPLKRVGEKELMIPRDHPQAGPEPNTFWALKDVTFDLREGEVLGVIGKNGAGKSTLLKILSRITEPTEGRIVMRGRVASLLEVGTGFHPDLTGRENIYLNGAILGMRTREIDARFDDIVEFSEVERFIDTPVKRYSSGMYVRLAFAVAAHLDPEILVVDEVLAVGDAEFQKKCLGKMQDVAASGRTVLFVSHNMNTVRSFCTQCVFIEAGRATAGLPVPTAIARYMGVSPVHASTSVDMTTLPRQFSALGDSIRFTRVDLLSHPVRETEDICFGLEVNAAESVKGLLLGAYIGVPGQRCLGVAQAELPGELKHGKNYLKLRIRGGQLASGEYVAGFFIRDCFRDYDYVREFLPFVVEPAVTDDWTSYWHPSWGSVRFACQVSAETERNSPAGQISQSAVSLTEQDARA